MYLYAYLNLLHPPVATPFPSPALAARALPSSHPPMACFSSIFAPFPTCTRLYFKPSTGNPPPRPTRIRIRSSQADGNDLDPIEKFPKGFSESTVRSISALKAEPNWMLRFRLAALEGLRSMAEPKWSDFSPPIDLDSVCYFPEPKLNVAEALRELGITPRKEKRLVKSKVALDAFLDATSIDTTHRDTLLKVGVIFCSILEAIREYPDLVRKYLGKVVPPGDNYYAALNSAVFSDGWFCYVPKNTVSPTGISTYFRDIGKGTGPFERTVIIAEENSFVSYFEEFCPPNYDRNQLNAGVVELYCAAGAEIKYTTLQDWYIGVKLGKGGIYNLVTKRAICDGPRSKISWTQVEAEAAIMFKYPSVVLKGNDTVGEFYSVALTRGYQQVDTGMEMIHVGKNSRSKIISKGISAGKSRNCYSCLLQVGPQAENARNFSQCDSMLIGDTAKANTYPDIQVKNPTARVEHKATTSKIGEDQLRGIHPEKAVKAMIDDFCRDAFEKLSMEFASSFSVMIYRQLAKYVG